MSELKASKKAVSDTSKFEKEYEFILKLIEFYGIIIKDIKTA